MILSYNVTAIANDSPTWTDNATGIMWYKCYYGQTWSENKCNGLPIKVNWENAIINKEKIAGYDDWSLPSQEDIDLITKEKDELNSIFDAALDVWSSVDDGYNAWYFDLSKSERLMCSKLNEKYVIMARSKLHSERDLAKKNKIAAEIRYKKEEAKRQEQEKHQAQIQAKKQERERQAFLKRESDLPPQAMYLQAGKYDRNGQKYDAIRLYELLVDKYPDNSLAIQATNRLVAMQADEEAASRLRSETNRVINEANRQQSQSSAECRRRKEAYANSCGSDSYCYTRARSICSE